MFEVYDIQKSAELVHHYILNMVDPAQDCLPYWLLLPNKKPAEAAHCRVDDAELVGSWYEGLDAAMQMLGTHEGEDVKQAFRRHLMKSWGEHGLRFCEKYPWTHTVHASFHEMGYILPALNRIVEQYPEDAEAERRASELVRGMRSLVIERKRKTFWSGDQLEEVPIYEFPNDVYLQDGGFDMHCHTGRGEQCIRNSVVVPALVRRYELTGDEVALDLAQGICNFMLITSKYFNYKMEYFGHVHSAMWFACGLVHLGRITGNDLYIRKGKGIYDYTRSISSNFGWVPEYAQWHPMDEEHCETCCVRDMVICGLELIRCGYREYWNDINMFARNQLVENQVRYAGYVVCDNSLPDGNGITYRDIDKRMIGGFTGGSEPNSISLERFRSIAGCCVGTAPVALKAIWDHAVFADGGVMVVNVPCAKETEDYKLVSLIPNEGSVSITAKKEGLYGFRLYDWNRDGAFLLNGEKADPMYRDGFVYFSLKAGETAQMRFSVETEAKKEFTHGREYTVYYRACDVVDITPRGNHVRLYQRDLDQEKYYPKPEDVVFTGASNYGPTQQKQ